MIAYLLVVLAGSSVAEGTTTRPDAFGLVSDTQLALSTALIEKRSVPFRFEGWKDPRNKGTLCIQSGVVSHVA